MLYERVFANPLLAMAFKDGIECVGDPDVRVKSMNPLSDRTGRWLVVIEDENDDDIEEEGGSERADRPDNVIHLPVKTAPRIVDKPNTNTMLHGSSRVSFDEFRRLTEKNMRPVNPRYEPGTIIQTIAEPTAKTTKIKIIKKERQPCGKCINCEAGDTCIDLIDMEDNTRFCLVSATNPCENCKVGKECLSVVELRMTGCER